MATASELLSKIRSLPSGVVGGRAFGFSAASGAGAGAASYDPAYGGIPQLPSPASSASQATAANIANLPNAELLAAQINAFNTGQSMDSLLRFLPNYSALSRGELPQDVITMLGQGAAERGIGIGSPGSPNANAAYLRSLGLTSLDMMDRAASIAPAWKPQPFNLATQFVTPDAIQEAGAAQAIYNAAPVPAAAAAEAQRIADMSISRGLKQQPPVRGINTPTVSGGIPIPGSSASISSGGYPTPVGRATNPIEWPGADTAYKNWSAWINTLGNNTTDPTSTGTFYAGQSFDQFADEWADANAGYDYSEPEAEYAGGDYYE